MVVLRLQVLEKPLSKDRDTKDTKDTKTLFLIKTSYKITIVKPNKFYVIYDT